MKTENNNSFSKDSLSNFESFYDDTKYEWYAAKHRKPSPAELSLVNGLSIECCPHCGGGNTFQEIRLLQQWNKKIPLP